MGFSENFKKNLPHAAGFLVLSALLFTSLLHYSTLSAHAATREEVLERYDEVIKKSNHMLMYGYDLQDINYKLKYMTTVLLDNQFDRADSLLEDIARDLKAIEAKGPERLRRERRLTWLEIYGDLVQQFAFLLVVVFALLRISFLRTAMSLKTPGFAYGWKIVLSFAAASLFVGSVNLIRYGQSAWAFVDLQILFVGMGGVVGGPWVGLVIGAINSAFRAVAAPGQIASLVIPVLAGLIGGIFSRIRPLRPFGGPAAWITGFIIGAVHSALTYAPIYPYLPWRSFALALIALMSTEGAMFYLFFAVAAQIFKEEKRKETERELLRTRLQFLQAQINPHFLFNTLNTIASVCGEERAERARKLIVKLSTFFRRITKQEGDTVTLEEEFDYIDAYLEIEQARFGEKLQIERQVKLSPAGLQTRIPILALQPIVENAVKHGLSKKTGGGKLVLRAHEVDSKVLIEVQDTGMGMSADAERKLFQKSADNVADGKEHTGIGLANIKERMERQYGSHFKLSLESKPNQGTTVTITLPKP